MAAASAFVYLLHRLRSRTAGNAKFARRNAEASPLRWGFLYFCAVLAALSHLLLDYTTAYGIRLFEPFNFRWYSWDIVYIIEPVMLLALVAGLAVPALFSLINQEIGARSKGPRGRGGRHCRAAVAGRDVGSARLPASPRGHRMNSFLYHGRPHAPGRLPLHD